jgi:hypothetical protein
MNSSKHILSTLFLLAAATVGVEAGTIVIDNDKPITGPSVTLTFNRQRIFIGNDRTLYNLGTQYESDKQTSVGHFELHRGMIDNAAGAVCDWYVRADIDEASIIQNVSINANCQAADKVPAGWPDDMIVGTIKDATGERREISVEPENNTITEHFISNPGKNNLHVESEYRRILNVEAGQVSLVMTEGQYVNGDYHEYARQDLGTYTPKPAYAAKLVDEAKRLGSTPSPDYS